MTSLSLHLQDEEVRLEQEGKTLFTETLAGSDPSSRLRQFLNNIKDLVSREPLPYLVMAGDEDLIIGRETWGLYPVKRKLLALGFAIEIVLLLSASLYGAMQYERLPIVFAHATPIFLPNPAEIKHQKLYSPPRAAKIASAARRGGGGMKTPKLSRGVSPKVSLRQIVLPQEPTSAHPALPVREIVEISVPDSSVQISTAQIGDELEKIIGLFGGPGNGGGMGTGSGRGLGSGSGSGASGAAARGGPVNGILPPRVIHKVAPAYTQEARDAGYEGVLLVSGLIETDGRARMLRVMRGDVYGLGKMAIEAVEQWRFEPAKKDGKGYPLEIEIEVRFSIPK